MKNKKIEKIIKHDMHEHTPDVLNRIDFESIEIAPKEKNAWLSRLIKPVFAPVTALALLVILLFVFLDIGDGGITPPDDNIIAFSDKEEAYTLSALSAISLLSQLNTEESNGLFLKLNDPVGPKLLLDDHLDQLNRNLNMIEPLIGNKNTMSFTVSESELDQYSYKIVFTSTDLSGRTIDYTMHYNETEEDENEFIIDGLMIVNNVTYLLEGELEVFDDGFELELRAEDPNDEDTYVEITQEVSKDEHLLEYKVVRNGDTLYESELSIEYDGDEVTVEIEYESETLSLSFEIERSTRNNQSIYIIEYDIEDGDKDESGDIVVSIVLNENNDRYYYRFEIEMDDDIYVRYKPRTSVTDSVVTKTKYKI